MKHITCIEDLRQVAHRRVPKAFIDYAESGSYTQSTLHANRADLDAVKLRQRVLVDVDHRSTETTIVGEKVSLPVALAPWYFGVTGPLYGVIALVLGLLFVAAAVSVWFDKTDRSARRMFGFSILYLFLLFAVMGVDRAPGLLASLGVAG